MLTVHSTAVFPADHRSRRHVSCYDIPRKGEINSQHLSTGINPLTGTSKPVQHGPLYSNTVIGTLAVDGWAVTFGTARRGLDGMRPRPVPSSL